MVSRSLLWLHYCGLALSATPYQEYILAPASRTLDPIRVYQVNGTVDNAAALTIAGDGLATYHAGSAVTYDFAKNIGGRVSFLIESATDTAGQIGISFTESNLWISPYGSDATHDDLLDEIVWLDVTGSGNYSLDEDQERGGFRYLNVYYNGSGQVQLRRLVTRFSAMPHFAEDKLQAYTGYFHCNDEKLNLVWYAGAYTNQLCTIPSHLGYSLQNAEPTNNQSVSWWSNSTLVDGPSAIVDGAKRDRLLWPGDLAHEVPGVLLSTNDVSSVKTSLNQLVSSQRPDGSFPYFGAPLVFEPKTGLATLADVAYSYTYHLHLLVTLEKYYAYSNDITYLKENSKRIVDAVNWASGYIDESGLASINGTVAFDWALNEPNTGHSIAANALLVLGLRSAVKLAAALNDTSSVSDWTVLADTVIREANTRLWDERAGFYRNTDNATLYPQDGNSFAVLAGIANAEQASTISNNLRERWTEYGAPAPEAGTTISPFISGFELQAHMTAGQSQNAVDLIRYMWHDFMLADPRMTGSTFIEGYNTSGSLHYPAYKNDPRVSHAHGWATGPITALTQHLAGIHVLSPEAWLIHPQVADLEYVDAGFSVGSGTYKLRLESFGEQGLSYIVSTPPCTTGTIVLDRPYCRANLRIVSERSQSDFSFEKIVSALDKPEPTQSADCWDREENSDGQDDDNTEAQIIVKDIPGGSYRVESRCLTSI